MKNFGLSAQELANIERVAKLDEVLIRHPTMDLALNGIQRCIAQSRKFKEPVGCMLLAEGGMGKSTVCKLIQAGFQVTVIQTNEEEISQVSAFLAEVPSPVSVSHLASNILTGLHDRNPLYGTVADKTKRIATQLRKCETQVVFLDEFHNLLNQNDCSPSANLVAIRWLKSLFNNCGICICLSGTPNCETVIDADHSWQLPRRFKYRFRMDPLSAGTAHTPGELYHFLTQMCVHARDRFTLNQIPMIASYPDTLRMFAATRGNLSFVMTLIKDALLFAWSQDRTAVALEDFAEIWDTGVTRELSISKRNPFRISMAQLGEEFRRHR